MLGVTKTNRSINIRNKKWGSCKWEVVPPESHACSAQASNGSVFSRAPMMNVVGVTQRPIYQSTVEIKSGVLASVGLHPLKLMHLHPGQSPQWTPPRESRPWSGQGPAGASTCRSRPEEASRAAWPSTSWPPMACASAPALRLQETRPLGESSSRRDCITGRLARRLVHLGGRGGDSAARPFRVCRLGP